MEREAMAVTHYTIVYDDQRPEQAVRHLTPKAAMDLLLTYGGYTYEIRRSGVQGRVCWELWCSDAPGGRMKRTRVFSMTEVDAIARGEIAQQVCEAIWPRLPLCMTDAEFEALALI
jgi:hypothetical protein